MSIWLIPPPKRMCLVACLRLSRKHRAFCPHHSWSFSEILSWGEMFISFVFVDMFAAVRVHACACVCAHVCVCVCACACARMCVVCVRVRVRVLFLPTHDWLIFYIFAEISTWCLIARRSKWDLALATPTAVSSVWIRVFLLTTLFSLPRFFLFSPRLKLSFFF